MGQEAEDKGLPLQDSKKEEAREKAEAGKKEGEARQSPVQKAESELKEKYLRLAAEFDNYKKRVQKEKMEILAHGEEKAVLAMLPILDDLDAAVHSVQEEHAKKGLELVRQKVFSSLEKEGLERIKTDGKFDEIVHEAVMSEPGSEDGKITKVISPGYLFRGKVLRHAKVGVSKKE